MSESLPTRTRTANFPELRIVPIEDVLPHEQHDPQRSAPLIQRIEAAKSWLNPPIVSEIPRNLGNHDTKYVVLDGANRSYSAKTLGFPHILVQVVDYFDPKVVRLETWNHVLSHADVDEILADIQALEGIHSQFNDPKTALNALDMGTAIAVMHILPSRFLMLIPDEIDVQTRSRLLRNLVDLYKNRVQLNRIDHHNVEVIGQLYPQADATMIFPHYTPREIVHAAVHQAHLPPGITRHIIQGRAMRLHYPLDYLRDSQQSLDEKNQHLLAWVRERAANKQIRIYEETTYLFDD